MNIKPDNNTTDNRFIPEPPPREMNGAKVSVFSNCIELPITKQEFDTVISIKLKPANLQQYKKDREWDGVISIWRHERVHFFQSIFSPYILDYVFERRLLIQSLIENWRKLIPGKGKIKYPFRIKNVDEYSAYNLYNVPHPLLNISARHIAEGMALFYQCQYDSYQNAMDQVNFVMDYYWKIGGAGRLYSLLYLDLCNFWGTEQAYWLFPLICWTSLIGFTTSQGHQLPVSSYVAITNLLHDQPSLRNKLIKDASTFYYQTPNTFQILVDAMRSKGQILRSAYDTFIKNYANRLKNFEKDYSFFPQSYYIKQLKDFGQHTGLIINFTRVLGESELLTSVVGSPPIILKDDIFPAYKIIKEEPNVKVLSNLTEYHLIYHIHDGILNKLSGEKVRMSCPHQECPFFHLELCNCFPYIPNHYSECEFPEMFEREYGVSLERLEPTTPDNYEVLLFDPADLSLRFEKGKSSAVMFDSSEFTPDLVQTAKDSEQKLKSVDEISKKERFRLEELTPILKEMEESLKVKEGKVDRKLVKRAKNGLSLARKLQDSLSEGRFLYLLGLYYIFNKNQIKSMGCLIKAYDIFVKNGSQEFEDIEKLLPGLKLKKENRPLEYQFMKEFLRLFSD